MNAFIRSAHRWMGIALIVAVTINVVALSMQVQAFWIGLLALAPLILMMVSGLWMFVQPYLRRRD